MAKNKISVTPSSGGRIGDISYSTPRLIEIDL